MRRPDRGAPGDVVGSARAGSPLEAGVLIRSNS